MSNHICELSNVGRGAQRIYDEFGQVICEDAVARPEWASHTQMLRDYYDHEWGKVVKDERGVFEALSLEALMVGLSWRTVLQKRQALRESFENFEVDKVAAFNSERIDEICADQRVVRNWRKLSGIVRNAQAALRVREEMPGQNLADLIWSYKPKRNLRPYHVQQIPAYTDESSALANDLRSRGFIYVGPTNMFALMQAIGIVDASVVGSFKRGTSGVWKE